MIRKLVQFITKNQRVTAIVALLASALLGQGIVKLESDHSARSWFPGDHPLNQQLGQYERDFGNDQKFIVAIYSPKGVFSKEFLIDFEALHEELYQIQDTVTVQSLKNSPLIRSENDEIELDPLLPDNIAQMTQQQLDEIKNIASQDEQLVNFLTDSTGTTLIILGQLKPFFEGRPNFKEITRQLYEKLRPLEKKYPELIIYKLGGVVINSELSRISKRDLSLVMPLTLAAISLILILSMGHITGFIFPLIILVLDIVSTLGLAGHLGLKFNNLLSITPGILISICIADTVHLMKTLKDSGAKDVNYSMVHNFLPTLFTSLTTAIGFCTLTPSHIVPVKTLGLLAAFGCAWAWILSYALFPSYANSPLFRVSKKHDLTLLDRSVESIIKIKNQYPRFITLFFLSVIALGLFFMQSAKVNTALFNYFKPDSQLHQAKTFFLDHMKGLKAPTIVIEAPEGKTALEADFLKRVDRFQKWIHQKPYINFTSGLVDRVKQVNQALHNDDPEYYRIPDSNSQIAEIHLLLTMGLPEGGDLKSMISQSQDKLKIELRWTLTETYDIKNIYILDVEQGLSQFGLTGHVGGKTPIFANLNDEVIKTFISSLSLSIGIIFIVISGLFRSFKIGLISLLPNLIPICTGAIVMYGLDIYLDVGTVIVFSVCFGIAVDDTIHFLINFFENSKTLPTRPAVDKTMKEAGSKLIVTTVTLVIGFGMFLLGDFAPNSNFGLLCVTTLTFALLTDLFFLPVLIDYLVPSDSFRQRDQLNEAKLEKRSHLPGAEPRL